MLGVCIPNVERNRAGPQFLQQRTMPLAQAFASPPQFLANASGQQTTHAMPDKKVRQQPAFGEFDS